MKRTPEGDCGKPCQELNEREHRFHLRILAGETATDAWQKSAAEGKEPQRDSARAEGAKRLASHSIQAAIDHHHEIESVRYRATKDRQVERLAALAEGATLERFAEVKGRQVVFHDWDEIPKELLRGAAAIQETTAKDGSTTIKIQMRDPVAAERALADLLGHNKPSEVKVTVASAEEAEERLKEAISRRARAGGVD